VPRARAPRSLPARAAALLLAIAATGAVALLASGPGTEADGAPAAAAAAKSKRPKIKLMRTDYGRILVNGRGRALYLFSSDGRGQSSCYEDCAVAWPPYIVKSKPRAGRGAKAGKIGTTRRSDGRLQATYAGHPVYFYEGDRKPGQVLCQAVNEFGGFWYVLRASGKAVT
jgi:predicted lipoprotein with Yx(FWY)xxD motif